MGFVTGFRRLPKAEQLEIYGNHDSNRIRFYTYSTETQSSGYLDKIVEHEFVTKYARNKDARARQEKLCQSLAQNPKFKGVRFEQHEGTLHAFAHPEDKNILPTAFIAQRKKTYTPRSRTFKAYEEAKALALKHSNWLKQSNISYGIKNTLTGDFYIELICKKSDLRFIEQNGNALFTVYEMVSEEISHGDALALHHSLEEHLRHADIRLVQPEGEKPYIRAFANKAGTIALKRKGLRPVLENGKPRINSKRNIQDVLSMDSPTRMLRWKVPVFTLEEELEKAPKDPEDAHSIHSFGKKQASLEDILKAKRAVIDIEVQDYDKPGIEKVYAAVFYTPDEKTVFTIYDPGISEINGAKVVVCKNDKELLERLAEKEREYDPLFVIGHNIMAYDRLKLKSLAAKKGLNYSVSSDEKEPRVHATFREFDKRVISPSRIEIDTLYLRQLNHLKNNKLETHAKRAMLDFEKEHSYVELRILVEHAKKGDKEAARKLAKYVVEDGRVSLQLAEKYMENIIMKSLALKRSPSEICKSDMPDLFDEKRRRDFFARRKAFTRPIKHEYTLEEEAVKLFKARKGLEFERAVFDNTAAIYPLFVIEGLKPLIEHDEQMHKLYRIMHSSLNPDIQFDIAKFLSAFLQYSYFEKIRLGSSPVAYVLMDSIEKNLQKTLDAMKDASLINITKDLIYISSAPEISKINGDLCLTIEHGRAISIAPGKIIMKGKGADIYQGIDPKGRGNTVFEVHFIESLVNLVLNGGSVEDIGAELDNLKDEFGDTFYNAMYEKFGRIMRPMLYNKDAEHTQGLLVSKVSYKKTKKHGQVPSYRGRKRRKIAENNTQMTLKLI